jgi:pSer/pThr/pTyr-binding forkhead associated (FHA) protein
MAHEFTLHEIATGRDYTLRLPCIIGRGGDADLTLSDPAVSQRHARIAEIAGDLWIEDLNSANGVYVNGERIVAQAHLKSGDLIQLGRTYLQLPTLPREVSQQTLVRDTLDLKLGWNLDHERLKLLHDITTDLSENVDLPVLARKIFARLRDTFHQDRSYLALFSGEGDLEPILVEPPGQPLHVSTTITGRIFQDGESLLLEDALSDAAFRDHESIVALRVRSTLCVPLIYHNQIYGLMYLDRNVPGAYRREDLELLRTIGFMLGPLIENARLWSELKRHYANAVDNLRETQARLITAERTAAYVRLAQAMAHEIRNPLTAIGGLIRRIPQVEDDESGKSKVRAIVNLVERVETILTEVDTFVRLPPPTVKLERIDHLVEEVLQGQAQNTPLPGLRLSLTVQTSHVMAPVDQGQFKKCLALILEELHSNIPPGSSLPISIRDSNHEIEIVIGEMEGPGRVCDPFAPELTGKPWSSGLFLTMAHKIISDHRGMLLLDAVGRAIVPVVIRIPRTISP